MSTTPSPKARDIWSADQYANTVAPFVSRKTTTVVEWLDPNEDDTILDVGCGEGRLTAEIGAQVKKIVGIDASPNMITSFNSQYPNIEARVVDCRFIGKEASLTNGSFDKIFSNAALHWILRDEKARDDFMSSCFQALRPGGKFVSESGGLGNVAEVHAALIAELTRRGVTYKRAMEVSPWYFPSLDAMRTLVERAGFKWLRGEIELRQTLLTEHEEGGIAGWVRLFGANFLDEIVPVEREDAVANIVQNLEGVGRRQHDGGFQVNYVRLRFEAQKPS